MKKIVEAMKYYASQVRDKFSNITQDRQRRRKVVIVSISVFTILGVMLSLLCATNNGSKFALMQSQRSEIMLHKLN